MNAIDASMLVGITRDTTGVARSASVGVVSPPTTGGKIVCTPTSFSFAGDEDIWHSTANYPQFIDNKPVYLFIVGKVFDGEGNTLFGYNTLPWDATNAGATVYKFKSQFLHTFLFMTLSPEFNPDQQMMINTWLNKSYSTINDGSALDKAHGWFGISKDNPPVADDNNGFYPSMVFGDVTTYVDYPSTLTITGMTEAEAREKTSILPIATDTTNYHQIFINLTDLINDGKDIVIHSCAKAVPSQ